MISFRRLAPYAAALGTAVILAACSTRTTVLVRCSLITCAPPPVAMLPVTRVTLLPQPDGRPSAVVVTTKDGKETLSISQPYQRATATTIGEYSSTPIVDQTDPGRVQIAEKLLFDLKSPPPQQFTLLFETGKAKLTPNDQIALNSALAAARARSGGEIVIIGYTDTVGTTMRNDELSLERAAVVRQIFLDRGFDPNRVDSMWKGKRELAVPTADEVDEPLNRRVTIEVR